MASRHVNGSGGRERTRASAFALALAACVGAASVGFAQQTPFDRLPAALLDATPPSGRVRGSPGGMTIHRLPCRDLPPAEVRRRIVDLAVQEWGFFGFPVVDRTNVDAADRAAQRARRRRRRPNRAESARIAASIAGYWAVTPHGGWILNEQNTAWKGRRGVASRWRYPWSAAFVSWIMCEAGLGDAGRFQRAVAHHVYIDQAIRASAADGSPGAFTAHDIGTAAIVPGDLLCSARRPAYRSIAERRRQMGNGARTHCDVVVELDPSRSRILAIGGNVRGTVALKLLPAAHGPDNGLHPVGGGRPMFAHLKLRAAPIEANALHHTPTMRTLGCTEGFRAPAALAAAHLAPAEPRTARC